MEIADKNFKPFINDIKDKLQHVDIDGVTCYGDTGEETMIDYIFVPKDWQVENAEIIDLKGTSDHNAICVDIKRR